MVFHPEPVRTRRVQEPVLLLEDGSSNDNSGNDNSGNDDSDSDDHFWPPLPKRPRFDEDSLLAEAVLAYAADVGDADDAPTTYQQAMKSNESSQWVKAMNAELKAHSDNYVTVQLDADTAFLNSDLNKRVYMEVPYDIPNDKNMMCRLDKAINGLKQAASAWHKTIHRVFVKIGFRSCGADECVYGKVKEVRHMYICLYVDDMIIAAKTSGEIQEVKAALKSAFKMKEPGKAKFILGIEIDHDHSAKTLRIKQTRYIDDVVARFNQQEAKMVVNPCEAGMKLTKT
ncbi:polyprotein [Phytophthora megakarya]|uniref:Polyprotein n=1 Tax=Phytophthora megakarya TaxID=4795 RepID=A0A225WGD6_9STRA|nr:polyprotein [Phytophthora megakarya]